MKHHHHKQFPSLAIKWTHRVINRFQKQTNFSLASLSRMVKGNEKSRQKPSWIDHIQTRIN